MDAMPDQLQIFTIGHSSHPLGSFVWLLTEVLQNADSSLISG
jgi:hypothetical protein